MNNIVFCKKIGLGDEGGCVGFLQYALNLILGLGIVEDGIFGQRTLSTFTEYQEKILKLPVEERVSCVNDAMWNEIYKSLKAIEHQPFRQEVSMPKWKRFFINHELSHICIYCTGKHFEIQIEDLYQHFKKRYENEKFTTKFGIK